MPVKLKDAVSYTINLRHSGKMPVLPFIEIPLHGLKMIYPADSLIMAPLSGYTDMPFRNSLRRHGGFYVFAEMVDACAIVYAKEKTLKMLERGKDEAWLGVQLLGAEPDMLKKASETLNSLNFDVIDLNLGCPVKKVVRKGEGAALAQKPDDAARALECIRKSSRFPVTAKMRIPSAARPEDAIQLALLLQNAGAKAITIHGRHASQMYSGPVNHEIIREIKGRLEIPVIGNGGVTGLQTYRTMKTKTGCDSVMVATGAMGNPWIFREILDAGNFIPPTPSELADEIRMHASDILNAYGTEHGMRISRKILHDYISGRGYGSSMKNDSVRVKTFQDIENLLDKVADGPSPRYVKWLDANADAPRKLKINSV